MKCPLCGSENPEGLKICSVCSSDTEENYEQYELPDFSEPVSNIKLCEQSSARINTPVPHKNLLPYAVFMTFCCCPPTGIFAVIFSYLANSRYREGDTTGAARMNSAARIFMGISVALLLLIIVLQNF